jgi:hypothetical protein
MTMSIDDHLGPCAGRYFGEGFKRVGHRLTGIEVRRADVRAVAAVTYPADWSRKAAGSPPPHLSTVDALVLAVQLAEIHLTHTYGLGLEQRRGMWLRSFEMRASATPQEDLHEFGVRAVLVRRHGSVSTYECAIGAIGVSCDVEHASSPRFVAEGAYAGADDILGPPAGRYYGDGYKARALRLGDVRVAPGADLVQATIALSAPDRCADDGFAGAHQPSVSPLDAFLALAQLAQVLAYRLDGLDRGESHTLWMRRVALESAAPRQPIGDPFVGAVALRRTRRVSYRGDVWRTLDMAGGFLGITARASMAHRLPVLSERNRAA